MLFVTFLQNHTKTCSTYYSHTRSDITDLHFNFRHKFLTLTAFPLMHSAQRHLNKQGRKRLNITCHRLPAVLSTAVTKNEKR